MEPLHERFKRLRTEQEFSVKELANLIEVPESTYREWEYGRPLSGPPFVKLAQALGVSLTYLMTGQTSENSWVFEDLKKFERLIEEMRSRASSRN